jgi:hypothetical protein
MGRPGFDGGAAPQGACPATVLAGKNGTEPLIANDEPAFEQELLAA